jgi:hypothetical protein
MEINTVQVTHNYKEFIKTYTKDLGKLELRKRFVLFLFMHKFYKLAEFVHKEFYIELVVAAGLFNAIPSKNIDGAYDKMNSVLTVEPLVIKEAECYVKIDSDKNIRPVVINKMTSKRRKEIKNLKGVVPLGAYKGDH